jgi:hypothetical protein
MRLRTPEYFDAESFACIGPEPTRADIKKNPLAFVHSVFPRGDQAALRDGLREVIRSQWWTDGTPEPRGSLNHFVKRVGPKFFECHSCKKKVRISSIRMAYSLNLFLCSCPEQTERWITFVVTSIIVLSTAWLVGAAVISTGEQPNYIPELKFL